jgi:hypothetical protein
MSSHSASVNSNNTNPSVDNRSVDSAQRDSDFQAISWDSSFVSPSEGQSHVTRAGGSLYIRYNPKFPDMGVLTRQSTLIEIMDHVENVVEVSNRDFRQAWKTKHDDPLVAAIGQFEGSLSPLVQGGDWRYRLHNNFSIAHSSTGGEVYVTSGEHSTELKLWNARNAYCELATVAQRYCANQEMRQEYRVAWIMKQRCCGNMMYIAKHRLLSVAGNVCPGYIVSDDVLPWFLKWQGPPPETYLPPDVSPAIQDVPDLQSDDGNDDASSAADTVDLDS